MKQKDLKKWKTEGKKMKSASMMKKLPSPVDSSFPQFSTAECFGLLTISRTSFCISVCKSSRAAFDDIARN